MKPWKAKKTKKEQGANYREVKLNGKLSRLEFTIEPKSLFWRAGFKLVDPNDSILPLRSNNSLLFHLGSTPSDKKYGFTAYLNGKHIKELNKTKKYPRNKLLTIRLEINHNNFLKVFVNGSLHFKPAWHLENPDIREKSVLIAWGDKNNYEVDFRNIYAANWKTAKAKEQKQKPTQHSNPMLQVTGNKNVFFNSQVGGPTSISGIKNSFINTKIGSFIFGKDKSKTPLYKNLAFWALIVAIVSMPWWPNVFSYFKSRSDKKASDIQQIETPVPILSSRLGIVRGLEPLETGKKIGKLPNGVYFFAHPTDIKHEIEKPDIDWLKASSKDTRYNFEIQKVDNRYYLLGYISSEAHAKIGSISEESIYTQLFPNSWGGAKKVVAVPFDAIYTIKQRSIDLDEDKSATIFDIGFKEVIENPELHKVNEL